MNRYRAFLWLWATVILGATGSDIDNFWIKVVFYAAAYFTGMRLMHHLDQRKDRQ